MEREEILKYIDEIVTRDQNGNLYIKEIDIGKLNHRDYVKIFKELDELNIPTDSNEKISNVDLDKLTEFLFNDFIPENVEIVEDKENKVISLRKIPGSPLRITVISIRIYRNKIIFNLNKMKINRFWFFRVYLG